MTILNDADLAPFARAELARRRLLDFAHLIYPGFEAPPHIALIAELLERIERGELRRLMINVPVRHGKSTIASQIFPSWWLGRHPRLNIILASHSEDLATRNSRIAKQMVDDDLWPFDVRLARDSTAAGRWNTEAGGGCYAVGIGGAITGRGADILLVDDALHDGLSETERESAARWYSEVAVPRLEPGGSVVMIGARFAADDLCGYILDSEDGPNWEVVSLPAIAVAGEADALGRQPGEALWPERMPLPELEMRRVQMGSRAFDSQFQQIPTPAGGLTFKREWFNNRVDTLPRAVICFQAIDSAWKTGPSNDPSAIVTWGTDEESYFPIDVWTGRVEYPELKRRVVEQAKLHSPHAIFVEEAASGYAIISELKSTGLPIIGVPPRGSKESRAEMVTPLFESGRVILPRHAPWLEAWVTEHLRFPSPRIHDDLVDCTSLALDKLREANTRRINRSRSWSNAQRAFHNMHTR